ncbi:ammonium transporter 2-like [Rhynchophorus ferrugineus]|uniref:ammonium transporter 2-like n=1 Tax=Rhynchophorus ferrugineus TaxID=354439 RepID=UPI003FCD4312
MTILTYGFAGFYLSYGKATLYGFINYGEFIGSEIADLNSATIGFSACLISTAISCSLLIARLRQLPILTITVLSSGLFIPLLICWCWSKHGWMTQFTLLGKRVSVKDYGGNIVVYLPSATIGLIGTIFLGRRIVKIKDIDRFSLGKEYVSGTVTGYFFIIIGHMGFLLPSEYYESHREIKDHVSKISVNSLLSVAAGILITTLLQTLKSKDMYKYWRVIKCLQGGLAGFITVSAGIDIYNPVSSFGIAAFGSSIFFLSTHLVHYSPLEDCCNIISIYLVCSFFGCLIPPLFGNGENLGFSVPNKIRFTHLLWQCVCLLTIISFTVLPYFLIFFMFVVFGCLKNDFEEVNHERAKILYGKLPWKRYFDRIFMANKSSDISPNVNRDEIGHTYNAP